MAIIEKGLPPDLFKGAHNYLPLILTLGIVSIGVSLGILAGGYLHSLPVSWPGDPLPFCVFLFLGLSLLAAYFLLKAMHRQSK